MAWSWGLPIADNLNSAEGHYYQAPFARNVVIDEQAIDANARRLVKEVRWRTRAQRTFTAAGNFPGGNQQKVVVARGTRRESNC